MPDNALMRYTIPMPVNSVLRGGKTEEMMLNGSVLPTVNNGGPILTVDSTAFEMWLAPTGPLGTAIPRL